MEQQKTEEKGLRQFYAENILRNVYGLKPELAKFVSEFYDKLFEDFDHEKVKHIRNAQSNMSFSLPSKPVTKITYIIGLMDKDTLQYKYSLEEAIDKIYNVVGDCTVSECIGCTNKLGKCLEIKTLQVTKFLKEWIPDYDHDTATKLKQIFNQKSIITDVSSSYKINFNDESIEEIKAIESYMKEYNLSWELAKDAIESGF